MTWQGQRFAMNSEPTTGPPKSPAANAPKLTKIVATAAINILYDIALALRHPQLTPAP
jgi:hypothetical protein